MADWYYGIAGNKQGPITLDALQLLARSGQLGAQTLVWCEGMPTWVPAATLPALGFPPPVTQSHDPGLNLLLPIGPQSGAAIAAGYLGLFSFLGITAPLAIIFGIIALRDLKQHPEKRGIGRAWTGIILGSLVSLIILIALIS